MNGDKIQDSASGLFRDLIRVDNKVGFGAIVMEGGGIFPLVGKNRRSYARSMIRYGRELGREISLVIVDQKEVKFALEKSAEFVWSREIKEKDGSFDHTTIDGVTITSNLDEMKFE